MTGPVEDVTSCQGINNQAYKDTDHDDEYIMLKATCQTEKEDALARTFLK